ncbi:MAG: hypothetical protein ACTHZX_12160, partial [Microbacterium sp.]
MRRTAGARSPLAIVSRAGGVWPVLVPMLITAVAAVVRFVALGHPHELVFDETYYVKDAWSLWNLGYEG